MCLVFDVSIVIPVYNRLEFLNETIQSILKIKTKYKYEVVVVNDGSSDSDVNEYCTKLREYKNFVYLVQNNKGPGAARNLGIKMSSGKYILTFDSDNILCENYLEIAMNYLYANNNIDILYSDFRKFENGQNYINESRLEVVAPFNLQRLLLYSYIDNCAIYRREVWVKNGGYEEDRMLTSLEDWEFWINAAYKGFKFKKISEVGFYYRSHVGSLSALGSKNKIKYNYLITFLENKYPDFFSHKVIQDKILGNIKKLKLYYFLRCISEVFFPKIISRLYKKNKIRRDLI